jgi:hypothetical protein
LRIYRETSVFPHLKFISWITFSLFLLNAVSTTSLVPIRTYRGLTDAWPCSLHGLTTKIRTSKRRWFVNSNAVSLLHYRRYTARNGRTMTFHSTNMGGIDEYDDMELWQAGNVEEDMDNLEKAIMYLNADENRYHEERFEALDYFAQQRHPVALHIRQMILQPMIGSYMLALSFRWLLNQTSKNNLLRLRSLWCIRCTHALSMAHFWSLVVIAPTFLLCFMLYRTQRSNTVSPDQKDSYTESFSNVPYLTTRVSSTKDTRISSSTSDYVRCILDQWLSCVLGLIVVALTSFVRYRGTRAPLSTLLSIQIITRWSVIAALHQYQSLWFTLFRKKQPLPLNWPVWITRMLTENQSLIFYTGLDGALLSLSFPSISRWYVPGMMVTSILWCAVVLTENWIQRGSETANVTDQRKRRLLTEKILSQLPPLVSRVFGSACCVWIWYHRQNLCNFFQRLVAGICKKSLPAWHIPWHNVAWVVSAGVALVGPVCHLVAAYRLFCVSFMHNASLTLDSDQFRQAIFVNTDSPDQMDVGKSTWRWRYRLKWRVPQRIHVVLDQRWKKFWYWLFLQGSVSEKLRQENQRLIRGANVKSRGLSILQRVASESRAYSSYGQNRTQWKIQAMDKIAKKHQDDYDRGTFDVSEKFASRVGIVCEPQ